MFPGRRTISGTAQKVYVELQAKLRHTVIHGSNPKGPAL